MSKHMTLNPIRTEADYRAALKRAEAVFDAAEEPDPDSEEGAYFEALLTLIEAHERKHYPVQPPEPAAASWAGHSSRSPDRGAHAALRQQGLLNEVLAWGSRRGRRNSWRCTTLATTLCR